MSTAGAAVRVLYVDDDPAASSVAERLAGCAARLRVAVATDEAGALQQLATDTVDCLVTAHHLPGTDSVALLDRVREQWPSLPAVLYATEVPNQAIRDFLSAESTAYVPRPADTRAPEVLADRITTVVTQARTDRDGQPPRCRYEALFERTDDPVAVVGFDEDVPRIRDANSAFERVFVSPDETVRGRNLDEVVTGTTAQRQQASDVTEQVLDGDTVQVELPCQTVDGRRDFRLQAIPVESATAAGVDTAFAVYTDISDRTSHERELAYERDRLRTLFEAIPEPAVNVEFTDEGPVVREVNEAFVDTFGYEADAALGENINDLIVPDAARDEAEALDAEARTGQQLTREVVRETSDGEGHFLFRSAPVDHEGETTQQFGVYIDITDRKRRERAFERLHETARELMTATSPEAVAEIGSTAATQILDLPMNGIHEYDADTDALVPVAWADKSADLLGGPPPTLSVAESLAGRAYRAGEPQFVDHLGETAAAANPDTPFRSEYFIPLADYGVFILSAMAPDRLDATDRALARVLAANIETALDRVAQRQALERERDRLDEFASVASHDLQSPLQVARTRLELAQAECESPHHEKMEQALDRMDTLLEDLLTLVRDGQHVHDTEPVALAASVQACWQTIETEAATLTVETDQTIQADPSRLRQLLENLIRNAVDHGGPDVAITVGALDTGFFVADDGPGIPPADRDRVFETGYSGADGGNGLGLKIVQDIAAAHDWTVTITESDAGGARFEVTGVTIADS